MLDVMVLEIILLMLTDYSIQFQGIYFEKLCVSLLNYSYHIIIIIIEDETCISPTPINYATYWVLAHPNLSQSYRLISYIMGMELALSVVIGVLCRIGRLTLLMVGDSIQLFLRELAVVNFIRSWALEACQPKSFVGIAYFRELWDFLFKLSEFCNIFMYYVEAHDFQLLFVNVLQSSDLL